MHSNIQVVFQQFSVPLLALDWVSQQGHALPSIGGFSMIYFHSIWERQGRPNPLAAGVVGFINTYTCLYIHISVFLFLYRLIVAGHAAAALVKCFYIESFKFTAHETRDVYKKQHQLQLQFPHCSALCLLPRLFCIAHLAVVAFQLTKLYFYFWSHIAADRSTSWRKLILLWPNGMARC